jgi:hypothetical protein
MWCRGGFACMAGEVTGRWNSTNTCSGSGMSKWQVVSGGGEMGRCRGGEGHQA